MAAILVLPGYGGKYTSETFDSSSTTGADTIDLSRFAQFLVGITHVSGTPAGSVIMNNSGDGTTFAPLGVAIDVATNGTTSRFDVTDGPFGLCRIDATAISAGTLKVVIVGFPVQPIN